MATTVTTAAFVFGPLQQDILEEATQQLVDFADLAAVSHADLRSVSTCVCSLEDKTKVISSVRPFNLRELTSASAQLTKRDASAAISVDPISNATVTATALPAGPGTGTESAVSAQALAAFLRFFFPRCPAGVGRVYLLTHAPLVSTAAAASLSAWKESFELVAAAGGSLTLLLIERPPDLGAPPRTEDALAQAHLQQLLRDQFAGSVALVDVPNSPSGFTSIRSLWLREVAALGHLASEVVLQFPSAVVPTAAGAALASSLRLEAVSEVLTLEARIRPCACCPCHGAILGCHSRANASADVGGASDSARRAIPSTPPEDVSWQCPITGAPLSPDQCTEDSSVLRLGPSTLLHFAASSPVPGAILTSTRQVRVSEHPVEFKVVERIELASLQQNQLHSSPFVLRAVPVTERPGAPPAAGPITSPSPSPTTTAAQLAALARALDATGTGLLATSRVHLAPGAPTPHLSPWPLFYLLLPDAAAGRLVGMRTVSLEESLPLAPVVPPAADAQVQVLELAAQAALADALPARPFSLQRVRLGIRAPLQQIVHSTIAPPKPQAPLAAPPAGAPVRPQGPPPPPPPPPSYGGRYEGAMPSYHGGGAHPGPTPIRHGGFNVSAPPWQPRPHGPTGQQQWQGPGTGGGGGGQAMQGQAQGQAQGSFLGAQAQAQAQGGQGRGRHPQGSGGYSPRF